MYLSNRDISCKCMRFTAKSRHRGRKAPSSHLPNCPLKKGLLTQFLIVSFGFDLRLSPSIRKIDWKWWNERRRLETFLLLRLKYFSPVDVNFFGMNFINYSKKIKFQIPKIYLYMNIPMIMKIRSYFQLILQCQYLLD